MTKPSLAKKHSNKKSKIIILSMIISIIPIYFIYEYLTKMQIIEKEFCMDVCTGEKTRVYKNINNETECKKVGGGVIINHAWGGDYVGCEAK